MTDSLAALRRRAAVKAMRLHTALVDRPTPWRGWQSVPDQLAAMGFHAIEDPRTTQRELAVLDGFLALWLSVLPMTAVSTRSTGE